MYSINNENIYYGFISGANAVINQKQELNRINVFPVPDGDTGTNLAFTMRAIIDDARLADSTKKTMESIAFAALTGARGNSGIIFAQFINGLYEGFEDKKEISNADFADAVENAVNYAYSSISEPVEGTMITVMREWSESLGEMKENAKDFREVMTHSLTVALRSLKETTGKLEVLRLASVVDSGAKGFVHFLEGFLHFITTNKVDASLIEFETIEMETHANELGENPDLSHRYCTEALIDGENLDLNEIRLALDDLGQSLIVAGNSKRARIHIHTNSPELLFQRVRNHGKIMQQKADDMRRQYESTYARKHSIALVTDSIADLPKELLDQHQIHMLPLNLLVEDSVYLDKLTISPSYLYNMMDNSETYPSSSQPSPKAAENFLAAIAKDYQSIIVVTVSKEMSGTYNSLSLAAEKLRETGTQIEVINSRLNSGAQGLVVLKAAEEIEAGKSFDEVVRLTEASIDKTSIFVSINTLKYMVRSGRVKKIQGLAAKVLNLKPVVSIDKKGDGIIIGKALSAKANSQKIHRLVKEISTTKNIISYAIVHADAPERASEFKKMFTTLLGKEPTYITEISSIVAMNAGVGCVAIAVVTE
jgi:hypothetical protein